MRQPPLRRLIAAFMVASSTLAFGQPAASTPPAPSEKVAPAGLGAVYSLDQFGKVNSTAEAQKSFEAACKAIQAAGGGILSIPLNTAADWKPLSVSQVELRVPEAPAPAKQWREGPGVTVIDPRGKSATILPSPITGLDFKRVLQLPEGQSLPHWNYNPMLEFNNYITRGSTSYRDWLQADVKAGKAQRFYVPTIRGVFPGEFLNAQDNQGVGRLYVQSLGYDKEKSMWYFVADTDLDVAKGAMIHNKNHANIMRMDTYSHNENQTFDLMLWRHNYSQGDNYLIDARFKYMGDVHSTSGDENGVIFAGFVEGEVESFRGKVKSWDPAKNELVFAGSGPSAGTLGSGRPIINRTAKKTITEGTVCIVRPGDWNLTAIRPVVDPVYKGKTYPSVAGKDKIGMTVLQVGGLIEFSADAPVTKDVVGRYFAVDVPGEMTKDHATTRHRWYLITDFTANPDGTKTIKIIRHWWGAKVASAPTLYDPENYSYDGHIKPLKYIIAPGVNAYDVSEALPSMGAANRNAIKLSPSPFVGTEFDFAPGDEIEQAIGPDPFHPIPFRSWTWDTVPSIFPAPVFDIRNGGCARGSVLRVLGNAGSLAGDIKSIPTHGPAYNALIDLQATSGDALIFGGDVVNAAIFFRQPNARPQPIRWAYDKGAKEAELTVSPTDGRMAINATSVDVPGGLAKVGGLSGGEVKANNLRGLDLAVKAGSKSVTVKFANAESDATYGVFVETTWMTMHVVTERTPEGFTVTFSNAPEADTVLHWLLVR